MSAEPLTSQRRVMRHASLSVLMLITWVAVLGVQGCATLGPDSRQAQEVPKARQVQASFLSVPLSFEANQGQTDPQVKFLSRGPGYGLFLTPSEAVLALRKTEPTQTEAATDETPSESAVLRMRLVGANPTPELAGETVLPGKVNYFIGNDPEKWRRNVPTYAKARYTNVYPGIDLVYYGNQRQLEYDFVVAPGQNPASITMAFQGMEHLELDANTGDLVLDTEGGQVRQRKPLIYQDVAGERQEIEGNYLLKTHDQVGFQVAAYDATKPLIIDPILVFSTYLGGGSSRFGDHGRGIAVEGAGQQAYVTGYTSSIDFPTQNPVQSDFGGGLEDSFVAKLDVDGAVLVYSTYLGGISIDQGYGIAVDGAGQAYVTGYTSSPDFPTTPNAFQPALAGARNAFVAQLTADGSALVYSTYLGGSNQAEAFDIDLDGVGQAYVTGATNSDDFPTTPNAFQPALAGARNAFVAQLTADGSALVYSTYLGGSSIDLSVGIAVDGVGQAYVTGLTFSSDFPTRNPFQAALAGLRDAFVAQLTADGSALVYSTYLGGSSIDRGWSIAVDGAGQAYVTGETESSDFPTRNPFQPALAGLRDSFVAQLTANGAALNFSTYLGGSSFDGGHAITVDGAGQATVTGSTASMDFPTHNPVQATHGGGFNDAFVAQFNAAGTALSFSTYLGGSGSPEAGWGIAVDGAGQAYVTGDTTSSDFPTRNAFQPALAGIGDAFVAKLDPLRENVNDLLTLSDLDTAFSPVACDSAAAGTFTITATFTNISADTLSNLLIVVDTLTGGNVLCNANGGPGGAGATLTVPLEGGLADGQLSPGESFVVELPVGLQSFNQFTFFVDVLGEMDGQ